MLEIKRRFESLRSLAGESAAATMLSNAAYLLGYSAELEGAVGFAAKLEVVTAAFGVEAGHKLMNFFRHQGRMPSLTYEDMLQIAGKELGISGEAFGGNLEVAIAGKLLGLREPLDPVSVAHRERLTAELNLRFRDASALLKQSLARVASGGLALKSLERDLRTMPSWAKKGTPAGALFAGIYGAYKLGFPDYGRVIFPCILLFTLLRSDLALAEMRNQAAGQSVHNV